MLRENELRECIESVQRIEAVLSSIEQRLVVIAEDVKADLDAMRERDFWEEYRRYMAPQDE